MFDRGMKKEYGIAEVLFECQNYFLAVWHFVLTVREALIILCFDFL